MSYQVIARKYRPQTFSDLAGQEHITRTLTRALDQQRLHHAYLFAGVRGTGKTTSARILAKGLNCHKGVTSQPCLQCPSCLEIASGNALDVLEIDAASNTGVDNVRDVIINNIAMAPARDRYKIFVIDEVHMLSNNAFNALLKTLEEPPSHVIFIMATTELHKVPDTILSRCQQFEFRQIPTDKIFQRLREIAGSESININDEALREIARAGAGSLRDAQSAFDQVIAFSGAQITEEDVTASLGLVSAATLGRFAEAIAGRDTLTILNLVEQISSRGYDLRNFTRELMAYLRHLLLVKSGITGSELLGVADVEIVKLQSLATQFSEEDLVRCFHLLAETEKEVKDSPHPRFQLEIGLVKLASLTRLRSLDELITRLEELEARLNGNNVVGITGNPVSNSGKPVPTRPASSYEVAAKAPPSAKPSYVETAAKPLPPIAESRVSSSPVPAINDPNGPPDVPDFDFSIPVDLPDTDFGFADEPPVRQTAKPTRPITPKPPVAESPQASAPVAAGREVEAIIREVQKLNRPLVLMALEDAVTTPQYRDGVLTVTFGKDDAIAKRVRDSGTLFRGIGEKLFGQPIRVDVVISGQTVEKVVDETAVKRQELKERAMQNPAVRRVMEEFRGEVVWVKESGEGT
ncbi:MAG TPA: DNA polymerase III subunit gamma/tau [Blastocatellia bacterium]|nr:DNA polymerase III subunit gamma/tau [Blastocatellia bacterium]HMV82058.1 DNA polymerase III subunit gamma/tau [Blastocatellia bacterium]HMX27412.1 DNA polymerase III subunit gamma/tau [Blastocatellia bacterium]HMY70397.1 DNA polymerase III subunit gamma/tau [Blastocatellia bacterium]HMZ16913.1 DNA polymerase III subunit gamma/tau [Blastocatellia bacterium]